LLPLALIYRDFRYTDESTYAREEQIYFTTKLTELLGAILPLTSAGGGFEGIVNKMDSKYASAFRSLLEPLLRIGVDSSSLHFTSISPPFHLHPFSGMAAVGAVGDKKSSPIMLIQAKLDEFLSGFFINAQICNALVS